MIARLQGVFWNAARGRAHVPWLIALPVVGAYAAVFLHLAVIDRVPLPVAQLVASAAPAVAGILLILFSRRFLGARRGLMDYGLAADRRWLFDLLAGLAIGAAGVSIPMLVALGVGWADVVGVFERGEMALWSGILVYAVAMLFTGLWEELLLRGVFLCNAADGLRRWLTPHRAVLGAIVISGLVFGVAHLGQPEHPAFIVTWVFSGVVFGVIYVISGNLALPIGAHAAFNIAYNVLFSRADGPGVEQMSAIMRIQVDRSLVFLGPGGVLDAAAFLAVLLLALLWLHYTRGTASIDLDGLDLQAAPEPARPSSTASVAP